MSLIHHDQGQLLTNAVCHAVLSTTNIKRATKWYTDTCGIKILHKDEGGVRFACGDGTQFYLYERPDAPKAENTVIGFNVPDLDATVEALRTKGVKFEEYDMPSLKTVNGIASNDDGTWRTAWCRDPDGNIIAVGELPSNK